MKKIKTICFQTSGGVNHDFGGLDRVTELLGDYFEENGYTVYFLSQVKRPGTHATRQFYFPNEKELTSNENIVFYNSFLKDKRIDVLINQEGNVNLILPLKDKNADLIYITALHFNPNYITDFHFIHKFTKMNIPSFAKKILVGIFKIPFINKKALAHLHRKLENNYYTNCLHCDRFILLSNRFQKDFIGLFVTKKLPTNISAINNPIIVSKEIIDVSKKKKKLLYVGRLECGMKQLDKLLTNWNAIATDFPEWTLHLVGGGPDEQLLKQQVENESIPRVFFEGIQNPQPYYEEASIFCFSSAASEGWGMVLVEAQIKGCVPVAFQSYSAIEDIITSNHNGILVPPNHNELYKEALILLMNDNILRQNMAENAMKTSLKFDINNIGKQWIHLIDEINQEKVASLFTNN